MLDITPTLSSQASQLNAEDLKDGDKVIEITKIDVNLNTADQPVTIHFKGENGMPFKPSLTVRRILSQIWGTDASVWRGRKLQLFCDPDVIFGGKKVGGIRIRAASHIEKKMSFSVKIARGKRGIAEIAPLASDEASAANEPTPAPKTQGPSLSEVGKQVIAAIRQKKTVADLETMTSGDRYKRFMEAARQSAPDVIERVSGCLTQRLNELQSVEDNSWEEMPA